MKIDYHLHLEEGPYNAQWMARTVEALVLSDESISPDIEKTLIIQYILKKI